MTRERGDKDYSGELYANKGLYAFLLLHCCQISKIPDRRVRLCLDEQRRVGGGDGAQILQTWKIALLGWAREA